MTEEKFKCPAVDGVKILKLKKDWPANSDQGLANFFADSLIEKPEITGPWKTKSGGELRVLFFVPYSNLAAIKTDALSPVKSLFKIGPQIASTYFLYEKAQLEKIQQDIRGYRSYTVRGLKDGSVGAMEFHMLRKELLFVLGGSAEIEVEDVYGGKKTFTINPSKGLYIPPSILHTYKILEDNTALLVLANTLYVPEDIATHDSFSIEEFRKMQHSLSMPKGNDQSF